MSLHWGVDLICHSVCKLSLEEVSSPHPCLFSFKQGVVTNFEIFRMREKQVPVDVVEMKGKFLGWGAPIAVAPLVVLFTCGLQLSSQAWPGWPAD